MGFTISDSLCFVSNKWWPNCSPGHIFHNCSFQIIVAFSIYLLSYLLHILWCCESTDAYLQLTLGEGREHTLDRIHLWSIPFLIPAQTKLGPGLGGNILEMIPVPTCTSAQSKVRKDKGERFQCRCVWMAFNALRCIIACSNATQWCGPVATVICWSATKV